MALRRALCLSLLVHFLLFWSVSTLKPLSIDWVGRQREPIQAELSRGHRSELQLGFARTPLSRTLPDGSPAKSAFSLRQERRPERLASSRVLEAPLLPTDEALTPQERLTEFRLGLARAMRRHIFLPNPIGSELSRGRVIIILSHHGSIHRYVAEIGLSSGNAELDQIAMDGVLVAANGLKPPLEFGIREDFSLRVPVLFNWGE